MTTHRPILRRTTVTAAGLAGTAIEPVDPAGVVVFCLAGGGMSRHYFDLPGYDDGGTLSMAEHLADRGFTVITLDHPGVGESPATVDGWELTDRKSTRLNSSHVAISYAVS